MNKTKAGPISADRLKNFIERIEKLEEERKAIGGDIRDVYTEAKGVGYDVKTMRRIVQLRKKDAAERDEEEQLLDLYTHALGMVFGGADTHDIGQRVATTVRDPTEDELMEAAGRIAGEVDRCLALAVSGEIPKIAEIQRLIGCSTGKASKLRRMVVERAEALVAISRSNAIHRENPEIETAGREPLPGEGGSRGSRPDRLIAPTATLPQPDPCSTDDEGLEIPSFLRREPGRARA